MEVDENTIERIKQELDAVGEVPKDLDPEELAVMEYRLQRLTDELKTLADHASALPVEQVRDVKDRTEAVEAKLLVGARKGKPGATTEFIFSIVSRLRSVTALLGYYVSED